MPQFRLGDVVHDLTTRTLVMGILNRTPDSFYDAGETFALDALVERAGRLVDDGADLLDIGGVKAGPGPEVGEAEELDRVIPSIEAVHKRFDVPISCDTWRASVLDAACAAGAVVGNDISGFADPGYLAVAARNHASVVATHIRLAPRVPDPEPHYDNLVADVCAFLAERARRAEAAGLEADQIAIDAGLDLGKTPAMSAVLLRESTVLAGLGYTLLLSASNKRFLGDTLGLEIGDRREVSLASVAFGVAHGCRIVRVHDVKGSVQVCRVVEAILEASGRVMSGLYLVKAGDPGLRSRAVQTLIDELVEGEDRSLVVEDFTIPSKTRGGGDDVPAPSNPDDGSRAPVVAAVVNAAQSPPFMTSRRIVVVRDFEQLNAEEAGPIAGILGDLLDTTVLVFVAGGGRAAKSLTDTLKKARVVGPDSEKTTDVLAAELKQADLTMSGDAARAATERLGDDAGRVAGLVEVLEAAFGPGASLTSTDVEPYLGEAGSVPVFALTNAIEEGKVASALTTLDRLLHVTSARQPKPMHPLQVLGLLASRYRRLMRLDDPGIRSVDDAHRALGGKGSTFPARKALEASRALGTDGLRRAVDSLHRADIDLKGASAMPEDAVLEVLVARLAALHSRSGAGRSASGGRAGARAGTRAGTRRR